MDYKMRTYLSKTSAAETFMHQARACAIVHLLRTRVRFCAHTFTTHVFPPNPSYADDSAPPQRREHVRRAMHDESNTMRSLN